MPQFVFLGYFFTMNLVIDIGNTVTKLAVFSSEEICFNKNYDSLTIVDIQELMNKFNIVNSIISEVKSFDSQVEELLAQHTKLIKLTPELKFPFKNLYRTPQTLGKDRYALVAAASGLNINVLIIDAGTCVTYDFLDEHKNYHGGAISPGLNMRLKALKQFTGKLPEIEMNEQEQPQLIGDSTENSIKSGVFNGLKQELQGVINQYLQQYKTLKIVLTGGNIERFDLEPKNRIFADKFFVLKGLNEILKLNAKD